MDTIDIKVEVIDYIRNSGESVKDYNIGAIVDNLLVRYRLEGIESYRDYFEVAVLCERHKRDITAQLGGYMPGETETRQ